MKAPDHVLEHLDSLGLNKLREIAYNFPPAALYEAALQNNEGRIVANGPLLARTEPYTGRSPNDRYIVEHPDSAKNILWGKTNVALDPKYFDPLLKRMANYACGRRLYVRDVFACADERYRFPVRAITEKAWHNLFIHNMFLRPKPEDLVEFEPEFTILDLCGFVGTPAVDGIRSTAFIIVNIERKLVIIGGTHYGGEMKKSIFSVLNYLLPERGIFPMHCSANIGDGRSAIFFGLSGTGKTTLSADQSRTLIGDDEHGWSADGVFNFEGGCYAKLIRLSPEGEPEIYGTTRRFGTLVENVVMDEETHEIDLDDATITQNTRGAYPIHFIPNASATGHGPHPSTVVMLTADAFGVMPPISMLTTEQAMYHFLSGYTAKVAGTEAGVTEPQPSFSACFGEPFMVRPPTVYAEMLGERIRQHGAACWLINTGWTGGPHGVGSRMKLGYTRTMLNAALAGDLDNVETFVDPVFGLRVPKHVPGVPSEVLNPRDTWADGAAYDAQANKLAGMFKENFKRYGTDVPAEIVAAGPFV